jgi:hypothetical protein
MRPDREEQDNRQQNAKETNYCEEGSMKSEPVTTFSEAMPRGLRKWSVRGSRREAVRSMIWAQPQPQEGPGEQENPQHQEDPGQQQSPQPQEAPPP